MRPLHVPPSPHLGLPRHLHTHTAKSAVRSLQTADRTRYLHSQVEQTYTLGNKQNNEAIV